MSNINFDNVYWLFLIIPLLALFLVPFFIAVRKDNANGHNIASAVIHVVLAVIIAFVAAGTSIQTVITETQVYVVADVSYSASKNLDTVDNYIKDIESKLPYNSQMGVVCFGNGYKVVTPMGKRFSTVKNSGVDDSATDLLEALEYTGNLFKSDVLKHIVLITDGGLSDQRDVSALKRTVDNLTNSGVKVDAIYIDGNIKSDAREVQLSSAEYTSKTFLNSKESVTAYVQCNSEDMVTVFLDKDGENIARRTEPFMKGINTVSFDLDTSVAGNYKYELRVSSDNDTSSLNNSYSFEQSVTAQSNILFLTEERADFESAKTVYGEDKNVDAYLVNSSTDFPYSVEDLCKYDEIVLSNIDVSKIRNGTALVESLDLVVGTLGKSLTTYGNTYIQGSDNATHTKLDAILPVQFGNGSRDPKLFTFVIDDSRSMELEYKLIIAKEASRKIIEGVLTDADYICVVKFDSDAQVLIHPTRLIDKAGVIDTINNIEVRQGTVIGAGLQRAYEFIANFPFKEKQLMLISDGLGYQNGGDDPIKAANNLKNGGIATSVIDVGRGRRDETDQVCAAAKSLLQNIASTGDGKYYYVGNDLDTLNDVVFTQILDDGAEMVIEKKEGFWLKVENPTDAVMSDLNTAPQTYYIMGYYNNRAKSGATTVLSAQYERRSGVFVDVPVYAYWNYGSGKVASFTSSFTGNWLRGIPEGEKTVLFNNVADTTLPKEKNDYPFVMNVETEGSFARISITPPSLHANATATVEVIQPDGTALEGREMTFNSMFYYYDAALPSSGEYRVKIKYNYASSEYVADASFILSYKEEYNEFAVFDPAVLYKSVAVSGGTVSEDGAFEITNEDSDVQIYTMSLTTPLAIVAVVLFVADIAVRKLKWADVVTFFKFNKKNKGGGK